MNGKGPRVVRGRIWRYVDSGPASGAENMAIDEQLLKEAMHGDVLPVLRFYTWDPPAVSLGRFQEEATAVRRDACRDRGVDIVRRITGGRAVLHARELTYSVVSPVNNDLFPNTVTGTYKVIAEGLLAGLLGLGVQAEMANRAGMPQARNSAQAKEPACFSTPSLYELVVNGRKIIGSAQRRLSGAFLQHGSILIEYDAELEAALIPGGGKAHAVTSIHQELGQAVSLEVIKGHFLDGFSHALQITLEKR
jgi:lipoate-protein ligase A